VDLEWKMEDGGWRMEDVVNNPVLEKTGHGRIFTNSGPSH